jgi:c-di-GMP-binding flagellar brake protein YcgR
MEVRHQTEADRSLPLIDARRYPRYKLSVEIQVFSRTCGLIKGNTEDISESGISGTFMEEVPLGEVVRLEFTLSLNHVEVHATVRQRSAFRYGFEFLEASDVPEMEIIRRACRELAVEQSLSGT